MINRARDIAKMMGYDSIDEFLEAMGRGDLILVKLDDGQRLEASDWLRKNIDVAESDNELLGATLQDVAQGIELAMELKRYPADTDICEMDLPHGWPSYCERELLE